MSNYIWLFLLISSVSLSQRFIKGSLLWDSVCPFFFRPWITYSVFCGNRRGGWYPGLSKSISEGWTWIKPGSFLRTHGRALLILCCNVRHKSKQNDKWRQYHARSHAAIPNNSTSETSNGAQASQWTRVTRCFINTNTIDGLWQMLSCHISRTHTAIKNRYLGRK